MMLDSKLVSGNPLRSCLVAICAILIVHCSAAQEPVSELEKEKVRQAVIDMVESTTRPSFLSEVLTRATAALNAPSARWSKRSGWKITLISSPMVVEYSMLMDSIMSFEFYMREGFPAVPENSDVLDEAQMHESARTLFTEQVGDVQVGGAIGYWRASQPILERSDRASMQFKARPSRHERPYSIHEISATLDRLTGCVFRLDKTFAFLPRVALGDGATVPEQERANLQERALDAYHRWRPLDQATIVSTEVSYDIPLFERHSNEMTEQHRQIMRDKMAMPMYRVALRGSRAGRPVSVQIYVDVLARSALAITEQYLDELLTVGRADFPKSKPLSYEGFTLPSGEELALTVAPAMQENPGDNGTLLVQTKDGGLVNFHVDTAKKLVWAKDAGETKCFVASEDSWKLIQAEFMKDRKPFGGPKATAVSCFTH